MPRNLTDWSGDLPNHDRWLEGAGQKLPGSPYYDSEVEVPDESDPDGLEDDRDLYDMSDGWMYGPELAYDDLACATAGCADVPYDNGVFCESCLCELEAMTNDLRGSQYTPEDQKRRAPANHQKEIK